jgi:hypothetical protein
VLPSIVRRTPTSCWNHSLPNACKPGVAPAVR